MIQATKLLDFLTPLTTKKFKKGERGPFKALLNPDDKVIDSRWNPPEVCANGCKLYTEAGQVNVSYSKDVIPGTMLLYEQVSVKELARQPQPGERLFIGKREYEVASTLGRVTLLVQIPGIPTENLDWDDVSGAWYDRNSF
jgi:hypothetical protein